MTEEMIDIAGQLFALAEKYKELYASAYSTSPPVVWVTSADNGETIFISDSFNAGLIKRSL